jgi:hypothetical protein
MDTPPARPDFADRARLERLRHETRRLLEDARAALAGHAAARERMERAIELARTRLASARGPRVPHREAPPMS